MNNRENRVRHVISAAADDEAVATAEDSVPGTTLDSGTAEPVPAFQLPAAPTGDEVMDLAWAEMAPEAEEVLARLPEGAAESWGDGRGITSYLQALSDVIDAAQALESAVAPTQQRLRRRDLRRKRWWLSECTQLTAAVYARRARKMYPNAKPSQVLLLVRDQLQRATAELMAGAATLEAGARGADAPAQSSSAVPYRS
jgi:hypothetical protein